jgi:hypothetical protein
MNSPIEHRQFHYLDDMVKFMNENCTNWQWFQIVIVPNAIDLMMSIEVNYRVFYIIKYD